MTGGGPLDEAARTAGVRDARVLEAMRTVRRRDFVPPGYESSAEVDEPVPIPHQQVTTQPTLSARMVEALALSGDEHVLEVGTGYGYQTALLATLARHVTSIDCWADLVEQARRNLAGAGIRNVTLIVGDGTEGAPTAAPYDAILVSAAFPDVPEPLIEQLRVDGRLVQPIGPGGHDEVTLFIRTADGLVERERIVPARFVRLTGKHGYA